MARRYSASVSPPLSSYLYLYRPPPPMSKTGRSGRAESKILRDLVLPFLLSSAAVGNVVVREVCAL